MGACRQLFGIQRPRGDPGFTGTAPIVRCSCKECDALAKRANGLSQDTILVRHTSTTAHNYTHL